MRVCGAAHYNQEYSSSLEAERDVTRKVKAREADAQLNAEREAAARSQTADQRDEADRQLRALRERYESESLSMGELHERIAQLTVDVQLERERAERAEDDLRTTQTSSERGDSHTATKLTSGVPLLGTSQGDMGSSVRSNFPYGGSTVAAGGVCGGLWHQERHKRQGWNKLIEEAASRIIPPEGVSVASSGFVDDESNTAKLQQGQETQAPWIQAVITGDFSAATAAARGGGTISIYIAGANADTKSERGVILEDIPHRMCFTLHPLP